MSIAPPSGSATAPVAATTPEPLLSIDGSTFDHAFPHEPFAIGHRLADHPLFQLERLVELAAELPSSQVEYNAGNIPISAHDGLVPGNGLPIDETIRRIEECQSWMALRYVEQSPEYGELLDECLAEVATHSLRHIKKQTLPQAFIFITSPGSITPYHLDHEHNFLLQVRGTKTVHLFDGRDRSIVSEEDLEAFYDEQRRDVEFHEEFRSNCWVNELHAGDGLYFPVTYPHYVECGSEVSISFSITWRSPELDRRKTLYRLNASNRKRGGSPRPVGSAPLRENARYQWQRVMRKLRGDN